jgi:hypothetical protein
MIKHSALIMFAVALAARAGENVHIAVPVSGRGVPWRACIVGGVTDASAVVRVIIHPIATPDFYVGPPVTVYPDKTFKVEAYFAEKPATFDGTKFEVRAYQNPAQKLEDGDVLDNWPAAPLANASNIVEVFRDSRASSGCGQLLGAPSVPAPTISVAPAPSTDRAPAGPRIAPAAPVPSESTWPVWATVLTAAFWLVLAMERNHSQKALEGAGRCAIAAWSAVCAVFAAVWRRRWAQWAASLFCKPSSWLWNQKGHAPTGRQFVVAVLIFVLVASASAVVFYIDAKTMEPGLGLIFRSPETRPSIFGDIAAHPVSAVDQGSGWQPLRPLADLWQEPNGPIAIGLAFLTAILGVILYWGKTAEEVFKSSPAKLIRERPLVFSMFLTLDLALAFIAGNRGFQLTVADVDWYVPAGVAGVLGIVTPLAMAYVGHFAVETGSDSILMVTAVMTVFIVWTLSAAAVLGVSSLLGAAAGGAVAAGLLLAAAGTVICLYLWSAVVFGDFCRAAYAFFTRA